jgi:cob(I)alamin adenosyltransferase
MVRIDRVVTRGGDGGQTSLGDGTRVAKSDPRIAAIGAIDEANAALGMLRLHTHTRPAEDAMLARIQNDLFDLGADLCVPESVDAPTDPRRASRLRLLGAQVERLEQEVTAMNDTLPPLTSFILPGGTPGAAHAHMARVTIRRAERALSAVPALNPVLLAYVNRLSDHLFVLARVLNDNGAADITWVPGANR